MQAQPANGRVNHDDLVCAESASEVEERLAMVSVIVTSLQYSDD
jgi:hypothetical protein